MFVWRVTDHILDISRFKTRCCIFWTGFCFRIRSNHAHKWFASSFATNYFTIKLAVFNRWDRFNKESTSRPVIKFCYTSSARWVIRLFTSRPCIKYKTTFFSTSPFITEYWLCVGWTFVIHNSQLYKWLSLPVLN